MQFLPMSLQGSIILITQAKDRCPWSSVEFPAPTWSEEEAVNLFLTGAQAENSESNRKSRSHMYTGMNSADPLQLGTTAKAIARILEYAPPLLSATGTYLAKNRTELSLAKYLHRLTNQPSFLSGKWRGFSLLAKRILSISAVLSVHPVPMSLFTEDVSIPTGMVQDQYERDQHGEIYPQQQPHGRTMANLFSFLVISIVSELAEDSPVQHIP